MYVPPNPNSFPFSSDQMLFVSVVVCVIQLYCLVGVCATAHVIL